MKRSLFIIIVLVLAVAAGFLYFSEEEISFSSKDTSLYKAIPVSTPFFFELSALKSLQYDNPVIKEMNKAGFADNFFDIASTLDSLIEGDNELPVNLRGKQFILSFGFSGRNELVPLLITKADSKSKQNEIEALIKSYFPPSRYAYKSKEYGKYSIVEINNNGDQPPVFYSFTNGLLLVSSKSLLLEQGMRQLTADGILQNPYFQKVNKTASSQSDVSFYLNHDYFAEFGSHLLNSQAKSIADEFGEIKRVKISNQMAAFRKFADWSELDFRFKNDHFILSGVSAADDSLNHFLSVFKDQQPVRFSAANALPGNTSFFCSFALSDKESFYDGLETYFTHSDFYYHREERMKRFNRGTRSDFRKEFRQIVDDEFVVATTTIPVNPENKTVFFILHTRGQSTAREKITGLLSNYAARQEITLDDLRTDFNIDNDLAYTIYRFPYASFPEIWLGSPFGMAKANYLTFFDNYMVFCNTQRGIQEYLRSMSLGATLDKNIRYQKFAQKGSNRTNINVYANVNRAFGFAGELFSEELAQSIEEQQEIIRKFGAVNWQLQHEKGVFFNSLIVNYNPDARELAQTTWQSTIGSNIRLKPQLVINHHDRANHEIIVQDEQNNLHQLTGEGRVRWTVSLPEPILSEIHQIDYYKNGNLQYLFNTKEKMYLVDRNGENVANFPFEFSSPATNGVSVFDYNNSRDYRYFLAFENKRVVAFDSEAKIVRGWEFEKTDHSVTTPVQHFRVANKDYIIFKDKSKVYIQNRRGETRVSTSSWFENSQNPLFLDLNGASKIATTDISGGVHYIFFNGEHVEKETSSFSENHFFTIDDLDGDNKSEFVFADDRELIVLSESGKKLYGEKFDKPVSHPPHIYTFGPKLKKVGVVEAASNNIYLFNPDGKLHKGFPLQGNSEFSIGKLSDSDAGLSLIVGSEGGKLYNYTLN